MKCAVLPLIALTSSPAWAQDLVVWAEETGRLNEYVVMAEFVSDLPPDALEIYAIWGFLFIEMEGDGSIIEWVDWNPAFCDWSIFCDPILSSGSRAVIGLAQPPSGFGSDQNDSSNPLPTVVFRYAGDPDALEMEFRATPGGLENTADFIGPVDQYPFGLVLQYVESDPGPDQLTIGFAGVRPRCRADVNGDRVLTPADFSAWVAAFTVQGAGCDQNGDGACTPWDLGAWILNFNAGC